MKIYNSSKKKFKNKNKKFWAFVTAENKKYTNRLNMDN